MLIAALPGSCSACCSTFLLRPRRGADPWSRWSSAACSPGCVMAWSVTLLGPENAAEVARGTADFEKIDRRSPCQTAARVRSPSPVGALLGTRSPCSSRSDATSVEGNPPGRYSRRSRPAAQTNEAGDPDDRQDHPGDPNHADPAGPTEHLARRRRRPRLRPGQASAGRGAAARVCSSAAVSRAASLVGGGVWAWTSFFAQGPQPAEALPDSTLAYVVDRPRPAGPAEGRGDQDAAQVPGLQDEIGLDTDDDVRKEIFDALQDDGLLRGRRLRRRRRAVAR